MIYLTSLLLAALRCTICVALSPRPATINISLTLINQIISHALQTCLYIYIYIYIYICVCVCVCVRFRGEAAG